MREQDLEKAKIESDKLCDLCNKPAMYRLCQEHLDDQTGNDDETGTLATEREKDFRLKYEMLQAKYSEALWQISFLKRFLLIASTFVRDVRFDVVIDKFLSEIK